MTMDIKLLQGDCLELMKDIPDKVVELSCAIGDTTVDGKPYEEIVMTAKRFIENLGGFEKFAEWGLV